MGMKKHLVGVALTMLLSGGIDGLADIKISVR